METESDVIAKAVEGAFEQIKEYAPEEYTRLNAEPEIKDKILRVATTAATEEVQLAKEFADQPDDIAERLAKYLPAARIKMLRDALSIPTFRMDITKKSDGQNWVEISRGGKPLLPARLLSSPADVNWATIKQEASIVVEAVLLVLSAGGISLSPSEREIEVAVEEAEKVIQHSSQLQRAFHEFVEAWKAAGGNAYKKAKALFIFIKEINAGKLLWTIIKTVCQNMKWYEWLETAAKVAAIIIAALATEGVALIARIALVVLDAVDFAKKIANLITLAAIKETM